MKIGDVVTIKEQGRSWDLDFYGFGVITMMDEGDYDDAAGGDSVAWKSLRVQWSDDFLWHDPADLALVSES